MIYIIKKRNKMLCGKLSLRCCFVFFDTWNCWCIFFDCMITHLCDDLQLDVKNIYIFFHICMQHEAVKGGVPGTHSSCWFELSAALLPMMNHPSTLDPIRSLSEGLKSGHLLLNDFLGSWYNCQQLNWQPVKAAAVKINLSTSHSWICHFWNSVVN